MTIDEAITRLKDHALTIHLGKDQDLHRATHLGIEALKRCKYVSEHTARWADVPLPGEDPQ